MRQRVFVVGVRVNFLQRFQLADAGEEFRVGFVFRQQILKLFRFGISQLNGKRAGGVGPVGARFKFRASEAVNLVRVALGFNQERRRA